MSKNVRILIVDDHPAARQGLTAILQTEDEFEIVGLAATGKEARQRFEELHPDVTLLDVHLSGESGLDVLGDMRRQNGTAMVLMISAFNDREDIHRAFELGAKGYFLKDRGADELIAAIHEVVREEEGLS